ncbi:hypothetical protein Adt_16999 [Abeliophyllum distichum]|uniref:Uncharacterized protein n=1 Tax=Abeliophyllum distichum TaxID=126358 RepID=A0ABD1TFA7_9LAMI
MAMACYCVLVLHLPRVIGTRAKVEEEVKSKKIVEDLERMSSVNTKLGWIKLDSIVAAKTVVKTNLYAALKDVKRTELRVAAVEDEKRMVDEARSEAKIACHSSKWPMPNTTPTFNKF